MFEMDDLIKEFIVETTENLDRADQDMIALELDPGNLAVLSNVFRTIHTIKGTCGFLGYKKLTALAHNAENLLAMLREGELDLDADCVSAILATIDCVRNFLANIDIDGAEEDSIDANLITELARLSHGADGTREPDPPSGDGDEADPHGDGPARGDGPRAAQELIDEASGQGGLGSRAAQIATHSLRIDVELVDRLMGMVGELVLTRNKLVRFAGENRDSYFNNTVQRLDQVTTELQEGIMKTRMQPIRTAWNKAPRLVRDVALSCRKKVRVEFEGEETELDKTVIEAIKDPLIHMVRNSVDHGIETPAERRAAGKPEVGTLCLRAFHEGGQVNIEITDDGRGLDVDLIRRKALDKKLITEEQGRHLSRYELENLIFLPGFSTAREISSISGRGVGMDVVRTNIERIGGMVDVFSQDGQGTRIRIKIPLTLAIIPAIIVEEAGERFAIPQVHLRELVAFGGLDSDSRIEMLHGAPVYRLRGRLLPLLYLGRQLRLPPREVPEAKASRSLPARTRPSQLMVLDAGGHLFGLVVDGIGDPEEIVVKPLPKRLHTMSLFAGAAVMGDGHVALILDVLGLSQEAGVVTESADEMRVLEQPIPTRIDAELESYLLVDLGHDRRAAFPVSSIDRLETFPATAVERSRGRRVVQYGTEIMPLVWLVDLLGIDAVEDGEGRTGQGGVKVVEPALLPVIVYAKGDRHVGIVVHRIVDIIRREVVLRTASVDEGNDTAIIQERVTDILDLHRLLVEGDRGSFAGSARSLADGGEAGTTEAEA